MTSPAPTPPTTTTTSSKKNRGRSSRSSLNDEKPSKLQSPYTSGTRRTTRARAINSPSSKRKR